MKGIDYLKQVITVLTCSHATKPEEIYNLSILESLKQIREGTHKDLVLWLRSLRNSATQTKRKKELPVFFYSGILSQQGDGTTHAYSGVVIAETDVAQDAEAARRELVANPHTLAIVRSVRGQNCSVLVPVLPVPTSPEEYAIASQQVFEMLGTHLVGQGMNNVKRYRTASYDPDLFINPDSVPFQVDYSAVPAEDNHTSPSHSPETISSENRELSMARLAGSLIYKRISLSGLETALQEMNKTLFEEPLAPTYISQKAQDYFNRFAPRAGENVEHFQARMLKYSVPTGDGQSGTLPDVRLTSEVSPIHIADVKEADAPDVISEINGNQIHVPGPEKEHRSSHYSVFYAELDKISQEYKYVVNVHLYQQLVRPLIVSLCSAHESIIHRLSTVIREQIHRADSDSSIELTLDDLVGDFFFDKAKKYFEHVLKCPFDLGPAINEGLKDLDSIRNVIVQQHAWIDKTKNKQLYSRIEAGQIKGVSLTYGELVIRIDYAVSAVNLIMVHLEKLITMVKERYPIIQGRTEKQTSFFFQSKQTLSN